MWLDMNKKYSHDLGEQESTLEALNFRILNLIEFNFK